MPQLGPSSLSLILGGEGRSGGELTAHGGQPRASEAVGVTGEPLPPDAAPWCALGGTSGPGPGWSRMICSWQCDASAGTVASPCRPSTHVQESNPSDPPWWRRTLSEASDAAEEGRGPPGDGGGNSCRRGTAASSSDDPAGDCSRHGRALWRRKTASALAVRRGCRSTSTRTMATSPRGCSKVMFEIDRHPKKGWAAAERLGCILYCVLQQPPYGLFCTKHISVIFALDSIAFCLSECKLSRLVQYRVCPPRYRVLFERV
jgi:hypothetical protein